MLKKIINFVFVYSTCMVSDASILDPIRQSNHFGQWLEQLNRDWEEEQRRRHAFWAKHDEGIKAEFINGEVVYHSPVYGRHWMANANIVRHLLPYVAENKLGHVAYEKVMCRFTRNDYEPDIVFWRKEIARQFGAKQSAFPPPDFIVEILSESTEERDRGIKFDDYATHGVREYWIVDPEERSVEQYLHDGETLKLELKIKSGALQAVAVAGFTMSVEEIFADALT